MPSASAQLRVQSAFSGPLPPPELLEKYNSVVPNAAERILVMAESQHTHRQTLEGKVVNSNISAQRLGTVLGFIIAMTVVVGSLWLLHEGRDTAGLTGLLTSLATLAGIFVYSKREQHRDLQRKAEAFSQVPGRT